METTFAREKIGEGAYFSSVRDSKFKFNRLSFNMILPLERERVTQNAIVAFLLRKSSKKYSDFTLLNARLAELYGAQLSADVEKFGAYQVLCVSINGLDDRYAMAGEPVVNLCAEMLAEIALNPNITGGAFPETDVALEKQNLTDLIESEINDKRTYARLQLSQMLFDKEPYAIKKYGYAGDVGKITAQSAAAAYDRIIQNAAFEIMFVGSGDTESAKALFQKELAKLKRKPIAIFNDKTKITPRPLKEAVETMDVNQGKLVIGMRLTAKNDAETSANRLMTALYGGTPYSKLFVNVREKESLCYYCAARYDHVIDAVIVDSGIEEHNFEKAKTAILDQLDEVKNGVIGTDEIEAARLAVVNGLQTITDSQDSIEGWYLSQILTGRNESPADEAGRIQAVTKEEMVSAAKRVILDSVYFLSPEHNDS